jgi:hypothetical protein
VQSIAIPRQKRAADGFRLRNAVLDGTSGTGSREKGRHDQALSNISGSLSSDCDGSNARLRDSESRGGSVLTVFRSSGELPNYAAPYNLQSAT